MTVIGALSSFRELGKMSPHKRAWHLSCDQTPLPRENVVPCRLQGRDPYIDRRHIDGEPPVPTSCTEYT